MVEVSWIFGLLSIKGGRHLPKQIYEDSHKDSFFDVMPKKVNGGENIVHDGFEWGNAVDGVRVGWGGGNAIDVEARKKRKAMMWLGSIV